MSSLRISHLDSIGGPIGVDVMISSSSSLTSVSVSLIVCSSFSFSSSSLMSSHFVGTTNEGFTFFSSPYLLDSHLTSLDSIIQFVFGFTKRYTFPACLSAYPTNIAFNPFSLNLFVSCSTLTILIVQILVDTLQMVHLCHRINNMESMYYPS